MIVNKITTEIFIERAKQIHGDKYDYSQVEYKSMKTPVVIICPIHGKFYQTPENHLEGKGCSECAYDKLREKLKYSTEEWIKIAKEKRGNKYDYSKVNYINAHTKVCIICPTHGEFWQTPHNHISLNQECPKCARESRTNKLKMPLNVFISKSKDVHTIKYDYSKVKYIDKDTKVEIICPIHGSFWQSPHSHLKGSGCPKCNQSKGEKVIEQYLNKNSISFYNQYIINIDKSINPSGVAKIDFYLPEHNLFIEYNGEQHYISKEYFGGELRFNQQQLRDSYVRMYCKNNNINLLEIEYIDIDNIENILNKYFKNESIIQKTCSRSPNT